MMSLPVSSSPDSRPTSPGLSSQSHYPLRTISLETSNPSKGRKRYLKNLFIKDSLIRSSERPLVEEQARPSVYDIFPASDVSVRTEGYALSYYNKANENTSRLQSGAATDTTYSGPCWRRPPTPPQQLSLKQSIADMRLTNSHTPADQHADTIVISSSSDCWIDMHASKPLPPLPSTYSSSNNPSTLESTVNGHEMDVIDVSNAASFHKNSELAHLAFNASSSSTGPANSGGAVSTVSPTRASPLTPHSSSSDSTLFTASSTELMYTPPQSPQSPSTPHSPLVFAPAPPSPHIAVTPASPVQPSTPAQGSHPTVRPTTPLWRLRIGTPLPEPDVVSAASPVTHSPASSRTTFSKASSESDTLRSMTRRRGLSAPNYSHFSRETMTLDESDTVAEDHRSFSTSRTASPDMDHVVDVVVATATPYGDRRETRTVSEVLSTLRQLKVPTTGKMRKLTI